MEQSKTTSPLLCPAFLTQTAAAGLQGHNRSPTLALSFFLYNGHNLRQARVRVMCNYPRISQLKIGVIRLILIECCNLIARLTKGYCRQGLMWIRCPPTGGVCRLWNLSSTAYLGQSFSAVFVCNSFVSMQIGSLVPCCHGVSLCV